MAAIDIGAVAEHLCAAELMSRGFMTNWPSSQQHPYDLIADNGTECHRIQVKGTKKRGDHIDFQFMRHAGHRQKKRYGSEDADFVILHLFEYDAWYVFPIEMCKTGVRIKPGSAICKHNKYLEAWDLLK